ncbi:MAG TPA: hypothetical protein VG892_07750 [Terriglobales bacterium]|nr:hypothetical protein [Terriglobales bacterium]
MAHNFEAKLSAERKNDKGIYLTFLVQPDDYTAELSQLQIGARLMVAWEEIVNTEVEPIKVELTKEEKKKEHRPFNSLPLSQQAAIRCQDPEFRKFINASTGADEAAQIIRNICEVGSRSEIVDGCESGRLWKKIERRYQSYLTDIRVAGMGGLR